MLTMVHLQVVKHGKVWVTAVGSWVRSWRSRTMKNAANRGELEYPSWPVSQLAERVWTSSVGVRQSDALGKICQAIQMPEGVKPDASGYYHMFG